LAEKSIFKKLIFGGKINLKKFLAEKSTFKKLFDGCIDSISLFQHTSNAHRGVIHNSIAMFSLKDGGIRTRSSVCDDPATPGAIFFSLRGK
jgi:hypothetical protein